MRKQPLMMGLSVAAMVATLPLAAFADGGSLAEGVKQGDKSLVSSLLKQKVDVNASLGDGSTALHWAVFHDDQALVDLLLRAGANPRATTRLDAITPLTLACTNGNAAIINALLKAGADPNTPTATGTTPLMTAAASGSVPAVLALLDHGAEINAKEAAHGQTALMFAAAKDRAGVIHTLIARGADPKITSIVTPLGRAAFDEDGNPIQTRPQQGGRGGRGGRGARTASAPDGAAPAGTAPQAAVKAPQPSATVPSVAAKASPVGGPPATETEEAERQSVPPPAAGAAPGGANAVLAGRRASATTLGGNTALLLAARNGNLAAVQALVEAGADINQPGAGDKTPPIVMAICNGHYDVAKYLLDYGANPNQTTADGLAALYAVIDTQWAPVGWAPNPITGEEGITYLELMKALLDHGAQPNARLTKKLWFRPTHHDESWAGSAGATPFWRAAQATDLAAMRLLVAHGADPRITSNEGANALMVAAGVGWNGNFSTQGPDSALDTVKYCLELGLDPTPHDVQGYTALAGAAYRGDNELVTLLVQKGAKLDARSSRGWSVTDMANGPSLRSSVPVKHPETVALLLKLGAPPLTAIDGEEILGIIRRRPAAAAGSTPPKTDSPAPKP
jgi:ankyrin repeat protein